MGEEKCILRDYVCDGIPDCTATISTFASDETNCGKSVLQKLCALYKIHFDCDSAAVCVDGDSRLIGGATSAEGLLETCFNGVYRPVNAEEFTVLEASTVCRQLGIATGVQMIFGFSAVCAHSKASAYLLCLQIHIAGQLG